MEQSNNGWVEEKHRGKFNVQGDYSVKKKSKERKRKRKSYHAFLLTLFVESS